MRDLLLLLLVMWGLFKTIGNPYIGTYLWTWLSLMNPHQLTYGFAKGFPFAQIIAGATLVSLLISKKATQSVWSRETITILILLAWMVITTIFAINQGGAIKELDRFSKIQLFTFLIIALINDKKKLDGLIWVIIASIGYYSVKGGLFTILTGGSARVWGPANSFIGGNNELALAVLMVIPLMRYLQLQTKNKWINNGLAVAMLLSAASVLGSQSRGAFLGIAAIGFFFWLKSKQKLNATLLVALVASMVLFFMPQTWWDRMNTIQTYQQDESAQGRINAWWVAYNIANDRITGGGARTFTIETFKEYAPVPHDVHDVHSIYFEMLGEQGWPGLGLFLLLAAFTWSTCSKLAKESKMRPGEKWIADLVPMIQVSLIGYYTAGAFLGLAYFDLYYNLIALAVITMKISHSSACKSREPKPINNSLR